MFEREVNQYIEWVIANLPIVAMRESSELKRIIKRAINETRIIRIALGVGGAILGAGAGILIMEHWPDESVSTLSYTVVLSLSAYAVTYVTSVVGEILVHKKIQEFAGVT